MSGLKEEEKKKLCTKDLSAFQLDHMDLGGLCM